MAPKKKGNKEKKDENKAAEEEVERGPTPREMQLKEELERVTSELEKLKKQVEELRLENDWLQQEAQETRIESHEYMSYMAKKTQKRQSAIVSLSDRNAFEIQKTNDQKMQMLKDYEGRKSVLRQEILEKEAELLSAKRDLESLSEYQVLQREQEAEIARLEKEANDMRVKHSEAVQKIKAKFIAEKCAFQKEADGKISELTREANLGRIQTDATDANASEARHCLQDHTWRIKEENRALRKELLGLIQQTRVLHQHKKQLEEQHKVLLREKDYASNLQDQRNKRQERLYKTFGLKNDGEG